MLRFTEWKLQKKRVFLRADLNVPLADGIITDDYRLLCIRPTLDYLLLQGASVILATHLGRPDGYDNSLSTRPIAEWLSLHGYHTTFVEYEPTGYTMPTEHKPGHIYILDNLRFFEGEKKCDELFARLLRAYADFYINDAFGIAHEHAASTTVLPELFTKEHRSGGFLIKNELVHLNFLKREETELTVLVAGAKGTDKIPYLAKLLDRPHITLLIGPALSFTFLKAQGIPVGRSLVNNEMLDIARHMIERAHKHRIPLILPVDIMSRIDSQSDKLITHSVDQFPDNAFGVTVGPQTVENFKSYINASQMIFCNSAMGFADKPHTIIPAQELIDTVAQTSAYRVAGGGDTVALIRTMHALERFDFCSTGGGSALAYISDSTMPALKYLE